MSPPRGPAHRGCPSCGGSLSRRIPARGFAAEGIEELIAEGVHGLERSAGSGQQPVLPVPGRYLLEYRRGSGDDRDRHIVGGPGAADGRQGLMAVSYTHLTLPTIYSV